MFSAFALIAAHQEPTKIQITTALVIGNVSESGRRPLPNDAIVEKIVAGTWNPPVAGDMVTFNGKDSKWKAISADKDGGFNDDALENGYLSLQVDEPTDSNLVLNARGDSMVYVNGVPRAGDPYGYGYLNLPIRLHQGSNNLLFVAGRGRISISLKPIQKPIWIQSDDATLPDLLTTDSKPLEGSVVVLNSTDKFVKNLEIRATDPKGRSCQARGATIPPSSARKLAFQIPVGNKTPGKSQLKIELIERGTVVDTTTLDVQIKNPLDLQKRTFVSDVDGSVQYYAILPASAPAPSNALVLTLHGAGVEAIGQAAAYAQKSWATIVAPTNRRPYGFDWEGIGRLDALEVLNLAKLEYPHDPHKVDLTGHSMGGHGTWSIGTMYPELFASISPSAGWISFWSYAGGWSPKQDSPALDLLRRSMNIGDTLGRVNNTLQENVYILHGDVDDNVPVQQARTMRDTLQSIHHPDLQYHEQPGANHWWGNQCVDWPPIFSTIQRSELDFERSHIDFTTQDPAASSTDDWISIEEQTEDLSPSRAVGDVGKDGSVSVVLTNVHRLRVSGLKPGRTVTVDGQTVHPDRDHADLIKVGDNWSVAPPLKNDKSPQRSGPFKQVFNHKFLFVAGTTGSPEENEWSLSRAIYDAESMMYRGNGTVDVVLDRDFSPGRYRGRNVILFGNLTTNSAYGQLLDKCPVKFASGQVQSEGSPFSGNDLGGLVLYPRAGAKDTLVGAVTGTGLSGFRQTDRLALFSSGVDYPDWIIFSPSSPEKVLADGFFSNDWHLDPKQSAVTR